MRHAHPGRAGLAGLRDQEAQARADRTAIERLTRETLMARRLPTSDDIAASARMIDDLRSDNSDEARTALQRWLGGTTIRVSPDPTAPNGFQISGQIVPLGGPN